MNNFKSRISAVMAAIIITLALLAGGQYLWQRFAVNQPLSKALRQINGVESYSVDSESKFNDTVKLHISLHNVGNLQQSYQAVHKSAAKLLDAKHLEIDIQDHRNAELEKFYHEIHYSIQEAIQTGNYSAMADKIQEKAALRNIKAEIFVDASFVYVALGSDSADMYVVIPRHSLTSEVK